VLTAAVLDGWKWLGETLLACDASELVFERPKDSFCFGATMDCRQSRGQFDDPFIANLEHWRRFHDVMKLA
jgi:hypothetical protein